MMTHDDGKPARFYFGYEDPVVYQRLLDEALEKGGDRDDIDPGDCWEIAEGNDDLVTARQTGQELAREIGVGLTMYERIGLHFHDFGGYHEWDWEEARAIAHIEPDGNIEDFT